MHDEAATNRRVRAACRAEIYKLTGWLRRLPPYHPMRAELEGALAGQERELAELESRMMAARASLRASPPAAQAFEVMSLEASEEDRRGEADWEALAEEMPRAREAVRIRTVGEQAVLERPVQDRSAQVRPAEDPFAQVASAQVAFAQDKFVHHPAAAGFEPLASLPVRNMMAARAHADPSMLAASTRPVPVLRAVLSRRVMGPLRFAGRTLTEATSDAIELVAQTATSGAKRVQAAARAVFGVLAFCVIGVLRGVRLIGAGLARGLAAAVLGLARAGLSTMRGMGRGVARSVGALVAATGWAGAKGLRWVDGVCTASARGVVHAFGLCRDAVGGAVAAVAGHGGRTARAIGSRTVAAARAAKAKSGSAGAQGLRWVRRACAVSARGIARACIFIRDVTGRAWALAAAHARRAAWAAGSAAKAGSERVREGWADFHPRAGAATVRWTAKGVVGLATLTDMTEHGVQRMLRHDRTAETPVKAIAAERAASDVASDMDGKLA